MKQTIGDKIRALANTPSVKENRRKLKAMYYISKREKKTKLDMGIQTFRSNNSISSYIEHIQGWSIILFNGPYRTIIDSVALISLSDYDSNGDRPLIFQP